MNDHQLLCFLTVQRILNFTAAAKELYCTQPALSYQIRSLEKELDLTLFERSTTRVVLTAAGLCEQSLRFSGSSVPGIHSGARPER